MSLRREAEEATKRGREGCCGPVDCDAPLGRPEPHDPLDDQGTWRDGFIWFMVGVAATVLTALSMGWLR